MIRARIDVALSGALSGAWMQLSNVFEDLLDRLPRRNEGSERLSSLLGWFKELQERVEITYLRAVQGDTLVENIPEIVEQVSNVSQDMDPTGVISEPHILLQNNLNL